MIHIRPFIRRNYATLMLAIIIFVIFILLGYAISENKRNKVFTQTQTQVSKQQVQKLKELLRRNELLGEQNAKYSRCLAVIFVQYTNNPGPIKLENFDKCIIEKTNRPINKNSRERKIIKKLEGQTSTVPIEAKTVKTSPEPSQATVTPPANIIERIVDFLRIKV